MAGGRRQGRKLECWNAISRKLSNCTLFINTQHPSRLVGSTQRRHHGSWLCEVLRPDMGILLSTPNRLAKISACGFFYLFNKYISTVRLTANSRLWPKTVGYLQIATRKAVLVRQAEHMLFCVFYHYFDIITTFVYIGTSYIVPCRPMRSFVPGRTFYGLVTLRQA